MIELVETREELYEKYLPKGAVAAELGVYRGMNAAQLYKITKPKKLYLCDDWSSNKERFCVVSAATANIPAIEIVVQFDQDWLTTLPDDSLDWVYLDTLHTYEQTKLEFSLLRKKVNTYIAGHDLVCTMVHNNHADEWSAGILRVILEELAEGWLEVVALTKPTPESDVQNMYPSWLCRVKK
jgi:hypothetical protein